MRRVYIFFAVLLSSAVLVAPCASAWGKRPAKPKIDYFQSSYEAYRRKDYDAAIVYGKRALREDRTSFDAAFLVAKAYWEKGGDTKAIGYLKKANRMNPNDVRPWVSLGTVYRERGKIKIAIGYFEKVLAIDRDNALAASGLAQCYLALEDYNNVIDYGKRAVERDPYDAPGHYALGLAYVKTDAQMAALEQYNILTQLDEPLAEKLLPKIKYNKFSLK
ncbi:MAG: tetratricopeptide repeat protein [Candidatus Omnitrophota bacterium]